MDELSGSIGELVFKRARSGATSVSRKPTFPDNRQFSPAQLAHQRRFRAATIYAKRAAQSEPLYAELAQKIRQPAYNVALSDYLPPPKIIAVEQTDNVIRIRAKDNVKVTRVSVRVLDAAGQTRVEGEATPDSTGEWWTFSVGHITATHIRANAYDLPGNEARCEGSRQ